MQLLARLMDHVLAERGERATIVGATSGDTGGAAIEAFAGRDRTDIFILFPHGRVSPVQQRQMTTSTAANVHALAHRRQFRRLPGPGEGHVQRPRLPRPRLAVRRQFDQLGAHHGADRLLFLVGDFARQPGPPRLASPCRPAISATSSPATRPSAWACRSIGWSSPPTTTTFWRARLETGEYRTRGVVATTSPSMDIQVSSNFERLLFEAGGPRCGDGAALHGRPEAVRRLRHRSSSRCSASAPNSTPAARRWSEVAETIGANAAASGYLLDPHTATAVACRR